MVVNNIVNHLGARAVGLLHGVRGMPAHDVAQPHVARGVRLHAHATHRRFRASISRSRGETWVREEVRASRSVLETQSLKEERDGRRNPEAFGPVAATRPGRASLPRYLGGDPRLRFGMRALPC